MNLNKAGREVGLVLFVDAGLRSIILHIGDYTIGNQHF